jgi:methyl-accepting chemotaxis protein
MQTAVTLLTVNVVLLSIVVIVLAGVAVGLVSQIKGLLATLERVAADADAAVKRIDGLASTVETTLRSQVDPTLETTRAAIGHVEATARTIRGGAESVGKVVQRVEALSNPAQLAQSLAAGGRLPGGRGGAAVLGIAASLLTLFLAKRAKAGKPQQP